MVLPEFQFSDYYLCFLWKTFGKNKLENHSLENQTWSLTEIFVSFLLSHLLCVPRIPFCCKTQCLTCLKHTVSWYICCRQVTLVSIGVTSVETGLAVSTSSFQSFSTETLATFVAGLCIWFNFIFYSIDIHYITVNSLWYPCWKDMRFDHNLVELISVSIVKISDVCLGTDVELRSDIDVSLDVTAGATLQAQIEANAIVQERDMFSFTFSEAVRTEDREAFLASVATTMSARTGMDWDSWITM